MRTRGRGVVPEDRLRAAADRLGTPLSDQTIADRIAEFFRRPRVTEQV
jgi:hypothetical protein